MWPNLHCLTIWLHLLKKSSMEIFCAVKFTFWSYNWFSTLTLAFSNYFPNMNEFVGEKNDFGYFQKMNKQNVNWRFLSGFLSLKCNISPSPHIQKQFSIGVLLVCNFIEIALRHGCSPVNLLHIFRTPFPKNTSGGLHLHIRFALFKWPWVGLYSERLESFPVNNLIY